MSVEVTAEGLRELSDVVAKLEAWAEYEDRQAELMLPYLYSKAKQHENTAKNYRVLITKLRRVAVFV